MQTYGDPVDFPAPLGYQCAGIACKPRHSVASPQACPRGGTHSYECKKAACGGRGCNGVQSAAASPACASRRYASGALRGTPCPAGGGLKCRWRASWSCRGAGTGEDPNVCQRIGCKSSGSPAAPRRGQERHAAAGADSGPRVCKPGERGP